MGTNLGDRVGHIEGGQCLVWEREGPLKWSTVAAGVKYRGLAGQCQAQDRRERGIVLVPWIVEWTDVSCPDKTSPREC